MDQHKCWSIRYMHWTKWINVHHYFTVYMPAFSTDGTCSLLLVVRLDLYGGQDA